MFFSRRIAAVIGVLCLAAGGAFYFHYRFGPRVGSQALLRVAVLPFENQTGDASLDWAERLIPWTVVRQMGGLQGVTAFLAPTANEAVSRGANRLAYGYLTRSGSGFVVREIVEDAFAHSRVATSDIPLGERGEATLSALGSAAVGALRPGAKPAAVEIHTPAAARLFAAGLSAETPADAAAAFESAARADPACGWCWQAWAEKAGQSGGAKAALDALRLSRRLGSGLTPTSRARLDLLEATLRNNQPERRAALERLVQVAASDAGPLSDLAQILLAERQFAQAEAILHKAIGLQPDGAELWNSYGYSLAYQGRFPEAQAALVRYAQLDTSTANPLDSQGEVAMMAGRFNEAATLLSAGYQKDPNFHSGASLEKAALAYWLNGDEQEAATTVDRLLKDRAERHDVWVEVTRARWERLFGRTQQSRRHLESIASHPSDPVASFAAAILALHALADGDPAAARSALGLARTLARTPPQRIFAEFTAVVLAPDGAATDLADSNLRLEARALGLTARGDWSRAAEAWQAVSKEPRGGADSPQRELLAFCLVQSGHVSQAAPTLAGSWPVLAADQQLLYDYLVYPNLLYARAEVARATRDSASSQRNYDLFLRYAGDRRDRFGQIARARSAARL